jgi:hypothetical protein
VVANKRIKPTAITRAGYEYQDLVGIEMLIRHYRDPDLFEWVQIESDDQNAKALDDVVALRKDGSVEYVQVKFTVNSEEYFLDWDWLLGKTGKGSSMLDKWAKSFRKAKAFGPIYSAKLKTNRVPTDTLAACMASNKVLLEKLDLKTRTLVEAECGGPAEAADFFANFEFTSAMPDLEHFEVQLRDQLVPTDTDQSGWLLLKDNVTRWAIFKKEPFPDGCIQRDHVVRLISKKRPKPIRQNFLVPPDYTPPEDGIDAGIRSRIKESATPITVLWGTPGRGKSTYLSHLTQSLQSKGEVVVRHHYFLSLEENSANRASFADVAASLIHQLKSSYPRHTSGHEDDPEKLRSGLSQVAKSLGSEGKRLYLVVDGLDHVYRDTSRTDQLDHLFNIVFPLPEHLTLIVGTQRVSDDKLPQKLLLNASDDDWIEIPRMSEVAVGHWLKGQNHARPLALKWEGRETEEISKISKTLFEISGGHPLHLIYAYEALVRSGKPIDSSDVKALPSCPDGDIRSYYKSLWLKISPPAKQVLHMLAGSGFHWPASGIRDCIGDFHEVEFLLEPHNSGLRPFHESIFAWLRSRDDHENKFQALRPKIIEWLENNAPEYWRWGWLWLAQAASGNYSPLINGADLSWAADSLAKGWPEQQIANILACAEKHTFEKGDLASTVKLRSIKTRVMNAREYQSQDFGKYLSTALTISKNQQQSLNLLDDLSSLSSDELVALARYGPQSTQVDTREACRTEFERRINTWIQLRHKTGSDFVTLTHRCLEVAVFQGRPEVAKVLKFLNGLKNPSSHLGHYVEELGKLNDLEALVEVSEHLKDGNHEELRSEIDRKILRSALFIGADPMEFLNLDYGSLPPDITSWAAYENESVANQAHPMVVPEDFMQERTNTAERGRLTVTFCEYFWTALHFALTPECDWKQFYPSLERGTLTFVDDALDCLKQLALELVSGDLPWEYSAAFLAASEVPEVGFAGSAESQHVHYLGFRNALWSIAWDIHLIGLKGKSDPRIVKPELELARASVHWNDDIWMHKNAGLLDPILCEDAAEMLLLDMSVALANRVTEFNERADNWTDLALFAHLNEVGEPQKILTRATACLLGYGYRKDMSVFDILSCIKYVHEVDDSKTALWIKRIAPIVSEISEFTDGDETRHARSELISVVAKTCPYLLHTFYAYHLSIDEWYLADDCLKQLIRVMDLESPEAAALCGTLIDPIQLSALEERADCDPAAKSLFDKQVEFLGGRPRKKERDYDTPDSPLNDAEKARLAQDPCRFDAADFIGLVSSISGHEFPYKHRKEHLVRWLRHWQSEKKARIALKSIWDVFEDQSNSSEADEVLDEAFQVSLASEGKKAAYKWLVLAHVYRHGWASYWTSSEEVELRLRVGAATYPQKWFEFIRDSSVPNPRYASTETSFSVGTKRLVRFLLFAKQTDIAASIVDTLIDDLASQVQDQPIPELKWLT